MALDAGDAELRIKLTQSHYCKEILNTHEVFEDVNVDTVIITGLQASKNSETHVCSIDPKLKRIEDRLLAISSRNFAIDDFINLTQADVKKQIIIGKDKWTKYQLSLGDVLKFSTGMQPYEVGKGIPIQTQEMRKKKVYHSNKKLDNSYLPLLGASNVQWMLIKPFSEFIKYGPNLSAMRDPNNFKGERILMNRILSRKKVDACYLAEDDVINNSDVIVLKPKEKGLNLKVILGLITSKYCAYSNKGRNINLQRKVYPKLNVGTLKAFPLPNKDLNSLAYLEQQVDQAMDGQKVLFELNEKFQRLISHSFNNLSLSRKLQNWHELEFGDFIKELNKAIKKTNRDRAKEGLEPIKELTKKDEFQWMELFEENKKNAVEFKQQIDETDRKIDQMVYELYGLSEEEIKIVEAS